MVLLWHSDKERERKAFWSERIGKLADEKFFLHIKVERCALSSARNACYQQRGCVWQIDALSPTCPPFCIHRPQPEPLQWTDTVRAACHFILNLLKSCWEMAGKPRLQHRPLADWGGGWGGMTSPPTLNMPRNESKMGSLFKIHRIYLNFGLDVLKYHNKVWMSMGAFVAFVEKY